jgi:hypothetical protein
MELVSIETEEENNAIVEALGKYILLKNLDFKS